MSKDDRSSQCDTGQGLSLVRVNFFSDLYDVVVAGCQPR